MGRPANKRQTVPTHKVAAASHDAKVKQRTKDIKARVTVEHQRKANKEAFEAMFSGVLQRKPTTVGSDNDGAATSDDDAIPSVVRPLAQRSCF